MDPALRRLIEAIHQAPFRCVLAVTGGGAEAVGLLLSVPGGSRTILEASVPYHEEALAEYLGQRPEHFCSPATARAMARRALERARWLAPGEPVVGVGCTAGLATDRPKKGEHRFHLAVQTAGQLTTSSLTLIKGARDREGEEAVLDAVLLNALAEAFALPERWPPPLLPGEEIQTESLPSPEALAGFLRGEFALACVEVDGQIHTGSAPPAALVSGAFNPVHEAHWGLVGVAARLTGLPVAFEMSIANVDKPSLTGEEVRPRLLQFTWRSPLWLTRAPTFVEKARLFPGVVFVVGADTATRIVAPRYYQDDPARLAAALDEIRCQGCRFLVAGRGDATGAFVQLSDLPLPPAHRDLFTAIPEAVFRLPHSSTQLRAQSSRAPHLR